ncbi:hypothetical protein [Flavobacterium sangjuense]|uniref:Gliding motility-associated protein GldM N-terminal domain-containing protein n=1 Tax=Flavobacterium sangjuense TaxID=2518177 RepID=A0A4V1CBV9_9FLAO|nr:hypothetical protein [Flavobacterium sangjuense]QBZ97344.1 hypothetical protein GS03_00832 [Flavobacterium sangjuense]
MARQKLMRVMDLDKARTRLAAVKSIDPALDLSNGITVANYETQVGTLTSNLEAYNTALSTVDNLYNVCIAQLAVIKDWNERILAGVATRFGKNSSEYEMAGGVKKSERKKPGKKQL